MNFERDIDVKKALTLGVFQKREFKDDFEAFDYIKSVLPIILAQETNLFAIAKLENYVIDYVKIKGELNFLPDHIADPSLMYLVRQLIE